MQISFPAAFISNIIIKREKVIKYVGTDHHKYLHKGLDLQTHIYLNIQEGWKVRTAALFLLSVANNKIWTRKRNKGIKQPLKINIQSEIPQMIRKEKTKTQSCSN